MKPINQWYINKGLDNTDDLKPTPFGRILRKTSLDESPQLISMLKGDMILIGPRPMLEYNNIREER